MSLVEGAGARDSQGEPLQRHQHRFVKFLGPGAVDDFEDGARQGRVDGAVDEEVLRVALAERSEVSVQVSFVLLVEPRLNFRVVMSRGAVGVAAVEEPRRSRVQR